MKTLSAVGQPTGHSQYDRIELIDRVVLKEHTLLFFLEGRLTNSSSKSKFTVAIPLATVRSTNMELAGGVSGFPLYAEQKVSRDVIHPGWTPETPRGDAAINIPIGPPRQQNGHPDDYPWERPIVYSEFAKLLPNTTRTIYPLTRYDNGLPKSGGNLAMEFVYVDPTMKQAYTVIYVDQVRVTTTKHNGYNFLLPLTVPADIATFPIQAIYFGACVYELGRHGM